MRAFEILLLILTFLTMLQAFYQAGKKPGRTGLFLSVGVILVFLLHAGFEKMRWQMYPAYNVAGCSAAWVLAQFFLFELGVEVFWLRFLKKIVGILFMHLAFVLMAVACLLSIAAPVFQIPAPGGPSAIGTQDFDFVDFTRPELFTADPDDFRELLVRVWYPANPARNAVPQPSWPGVERIGPLLLARLQLPTFLLDYMALVPSHSYLGAPLSVTSPKYPVLVFSHGYADDLPSELTVMEELASHGYIVFAISHTYEALATEFPDGRIVLADPRAFSSPFRPQPRQVDLNDQLSVWVKDTRFVLDKLEEFNAGQNGDFFAGRLDLEKIGIFGMSFGGATATEVCLRDSRCQAGANMDGSTFGYVDYGRNHLKIPFLFFYNEHSEGMNDHVYSGVENWAYRVTIDGTTHLSFTDKVLWSPYLKYANQFISYNLGPIAAQRIIEIKRAYLLAFFDRHLKGALTPFLDRPSALYPEVHYKFRPPYE